MKSARDNDVISRREFILKTGVAGALVAANIRAATDAKNLTAVVIGHTGAGDYGHGLDVVFKDLPGVRTMAVADVDAAGREKARQRIGAERAYADYREMIAKEKPNLVSVAPRWTEEHFAMIGAALEAGAHVFSEKPFTTTPREADQLLDLAARKHLRIVVAHQMGLAPNIRALRDQITDGSLGELAQMRAFGKQDARAGGEDMLVLGTHLFDLMRMFAGEARRCSASIWWKGQVAKREDARKATEGIGAILGDEIEAQFEFDRGVVGTFTSRGRLREAVGAWRLDLIGTKGSAVILPGIEPAVYLVKGIFNAETKRDQATPLPIVAGERGTEAANRRLAMDWLKAIEEKREPVCSGANAAKAVEMVMAVYEAHLSGRRVELPLVKREHPLRVQAAIRG